MPKVDIPIDVTIDALTFNTRRKFTLGIHIYNRRFVDQQFERTIEASEPLGSAEIEAITAHFRGLNPDLRVFISPQVCELLESD